MLYILSYMYVAINTGSAGPGNTFLWFSGLLHKQACLDQALQQRLVVGWFNQEPNALLHTI